MQRRKFLVLIGGPHLFTSSAPAFADSSSPQLASYYDRHMALLDGVAYGWTGRGQPVRLRTGARQVGVSQEAFFALQDDGRLFSWGAAPESASLLMPGVGAFSSGQSGWFAIDPAQVLWHGGSRLQAPRRIAQDVTDACIGDSADYYIVRFRSSAKRPLCAKHGRPLRVDRWRTESESAFQVPDISNGEPSRSVTCRRKHGRPLVDLAIRSIYDNANRKDEVLNVRADHHVHQGPGHDSA